MSTYAGADSGGPSNKVTLKRGRRKGKGQAQTEREAVPLIQFETKKEEGAYLLVTSGEVGWFPNGVFGVTEQLLQQLGPRFQEKGIRYCLLGSQEMNQRKDR
jgi:hypothetical protein